MSERVACLKCKHYYSTFDPDKPRGCRFYGFSAASIPSSVVKRESGENCQAFELSQAHKKKKKPNSLNDPFYW